MQVRRIAAALMFWMLAMLAAPSGAPGGGEAPPPPPPPPSGCSLNEVACENLLPGNPESEWSITDAGDDTIQGFATDISVNRGTTVHFKIDTNAHAYRLDIYRLGYYAGMGARKVATVTPSAALPQVQPNCDEDTDTGLVDCGNWAESASWLVPSDAVSGIYFARAVRTDTNGASQIFFIVRNDASTSDLLFQTSDTTWEAYNDYGGNSFYVGNPVGRAYKVSYNRPFHTAVSEPESWVFNAEYPMVRWLEANGYDVSYATGVDSDRYGDLIRNHKVFMSVGHDEYWSAGQRANVEAARDNVKAPVRPTATHLAFFSGNESFWKTRWEPSIDGTATTYRTLVCYKETHANAKIDPNPQWTGTWRDNRSINPDGPYPENGMSGTIFMVNGDRTDSIMVPAAYAQNRFWRHTSIAGLAPGQTAILPPGTLGYEWDEDLDNGFRPQGLTDLSSTTIDVTPKFLLDQGSNYGAGTATHSLTMYKASSGALVFGAGTVQWSWGLDHDHIRGDEPPSTDMQQATVNLLVDMGANPATPQLGMVVDSGSSDAIAPISTITSPTNGALLQNGDSITISGTAQDGPTRGGGKVSAVELSFDNGTTWHGATGITDGTGVFNWTYDWAPSVSGTVAILGRAIDDSGNIQAPPVSVGVTVERICPCSIWNDSFLPATDQQFDSTAAAGGVNLGVRFTSDTDGQILGIRFYRGTGNGGTHIGTLWADDGTGTPLASVTFTNESPAGTNGWQQAFFSAPVPITAGTTYIASYLTHAYSITRPGFTTAFSNPPLTAAADGANGGDGTNGNGLYNYGSTPTFPTHSFGATNYLVDVVFAPNAAADTTPPIVTSHSPVNGATGVTPFINVTAKFSETIDTTTLTAPGVFELRDSSLALVPSTISYDPTSRTATLHPLTRLVDSTSYTVTLHGPGGVADLAGNRMTSDVTWSFTTATPVMCPCSIWTPDTVPSFLVNNSDDPDAIAQGIELGVRFRSDVDGFIKGVRFYKSLNNTGIHSGTLWDNAGNVLATATFTGETSTGWQEVDFSTPVAVTANQTYVASYHAPGGHYSVNRTYFLQQFSSSFSRPPLRALLDGEDGPNGVYQLGPQAFPTQTFLQSNYWVDVVFDTTTGANQPPTATAQSVTTNEDTAAAIQLSGTDPENNPLTFALAVSPAHGALSGALPNLTYTPATDYFGSDSFTFTANDGTMDSAPATVSINVLSVNDAPSFTSGGNQTVAEDAGPQTVVWAAATSAGPANEAGQQLNFVVSNNNTALFSAQPAISANGTLTYTPAVHASGSATVTVALHDDGGTANGGIDTSASQTFTITVTHVNHPPVLATIPNQNGSENSLLTFNLSATDPDSGDTLTYSATGLPGGASLNASTGAFSWTPSFTQAGTYPVTFTVTDSETPALSASQLVTITIANTNRPPVLAPIANQSVADNATLTFNLSATDPDGDAITYSASALPMGATLTGNVFSWSPAYGQAGTYPITFTATDNGTPAPLNASQAMTITVTHVNRLPTMTAVANQSTPEETPIAVNVTVGDLETAAASLTVTGASSNTTLVPNANIVVSGSGSTRTVTITPAIGQTGTTTITLMVTDADGGTATRSFLLTVTPKTSTTTSTPTSSLNPSTYGQSVTFTTTVTGAGGPPTGTVSFYDTGVLLGTATLSGGTASLATTAVAAGTRSITAVYDGNTTFLGSTSGALTQTVNKATTTTSLTASPLQQQYSDVETLQATISNPAAAQSVTFKIGAVELGTVPVDSTGKASLSPQLLGAIGIGTKIITAQFNSVNPNYTVSNASKSMTVMREDTAPFVYSGPTTIKLSGGTVTMTVQVADIADGNRGDIGNATVAFINRGTGATIGTATVVPTGDHTTGTATLTWSATAGTYSIGFSAGNYYVRNNTADNVTITVTN